MITPSKRLNDLKDEWDGKLGRFKRLSKEYIFLTNQLAELNVEIYNLCKEEGIDINILLNKPQKINP